MPDDGHRARVATPNDAEGVGAFFKQSYPTLMKSAYDDALLAPALALMTKANPALLDCGTYYVAESESGTIVGCGGWTIERPGDDVVQPELGHILALRYASGLDKARYRSSDLRYV